MLPCPWNWLIIIVGKGIKVLTSTIGSKVAVTVTSESGIMKLAVVGQPASLITKPLTFDVHPLKV
jgi:hypothetical protein